LITNNATYRKQGKSPYLGLCNVLSQSEINNNKLTQKICDATK